MKFENPIQLPTRHARPTRKEQLRWDLSGHLRDYPTTRRCITVALRKRKGSLDQIWVICHERVAAWHIHCAGAIRSFLDKKAGRT